MKRIDWFLAATLLIACVAAFPLLSQAGLVNTRGGGDSPFLLQRLHQLETAVLDGHFPVRWMPDANYGYGYPFFNYYAPLSIYIAFFFRLIGFSFVRAIQLAQFAGFLVAAWGMYKLARRWFGSEWAGMLTAVAYTIAPFHLVNVYVRGDSLAEFWAMAFYPLVILAADALLEISVKAPSAHGAKGKRTRLKRVVLLGMAYAGLILSHNISALIFSPFLIVYVLFRSFSFYDTRATLSSLYATLSPPFLAGLLGLALSAWFFVPALVETNLAQLEAVTEGYFFYGTHFLGTDKLPLVQDSFFFDFRVNGRQAFRMGLFQAIVGVGSFVVLLWGSLKKGGPKWPNTALIVLLILAPTILMLPFSASIWETVPLLSFAQFPWRFLSVQAFGLALAAGGFSLVPGKRPLVLLLIAGGLLTSLGRLSVDHLILTDTDITAEKLAQYEWFTGNIGTTVSAEYLPQTVSSRPYTSYWLNTGEREHVVAVAGMLNQVDLLVRKTGQQVWQVDTAVPTTLRLDTLYWPGWRAFVDGAETPLFPSPDSGLMMLDVAAGKHTIELKLRRTPVRLWAELASLTTVLLLGWLLWSAGRPRFSRLRGGILIGLIGLVVLVQLWPKINHPKDLLTWDFAQMGYLHHDPDGISFENGARLLGYTIDQTNVQAGDEVTFRLQWAAAPPPFTLALASPAVNRPEFSPSAPVVVEAASQKGVVQLSIPETAASGLYVPRLTMADGRALTPSGSQRGALFLRPIRIEGANALPPSMRPLDAQALQVQMVEPEVLDVQIGWWTERPLIQNYNVALRLTDVDGNFLRLVDHQPGYGYLPSRDWPAGEWVIDHHAVPLPPSDEGHRQPFVLVAQLYDAGNPQRVVLTRRLGEVAREGDAVRFQPTEALFSLPETVTAETAVFGNQIALRGYHFDQADGVISLELVWEALELGHVDYVRFVHLIYGEEPGPPLAQVDNMPRQGSYPTTQWQKGEIVTETIMLDIKDVPAGQYQLAVGFYEKVDEVGVRLTAVDHNNTPLPDNQIILPFTIIIP